MPTLSYSNRKRILLGHHYWGRGGAEVAAMWAIQALSPNYLVDVLTRGGWNLEELNQCAGTEISPKQLGEILYPPLDPQVLSRGGALWQGLFHRYCRRIAPGYDLCMTASRVIDWGQPAVHFLSDVAWNRSLQQRFQCPEALIGASWLRRAYFALGRTIAGTSGRDPAQHDVFVANSEWTARISAEYCQLPPVVIHPAVTAGGQILPWAERENSFICLGRISPEKQIERVIDILEQVRTFGHCIKLHLVGGGDEAEYLRQIQKLQTKRQDWIVWHGPLYANDKWSLLARCRYGLSACEAFGIATAEMTLTGVVPFVPRAGAQSEIVQAGELIYGDIQEAAIKIDAVLKSDSRQLEIQQALLRRATAFAPENFCKAVREVVEQVFAPKGHVSTGSQNWADVL